MITYSDIGAYSNGVFYTEDGGKTWNPMNITIGGENFYPSTSYKKSPQRFVVHPSNPNLMYIITHSHILKSSDAGQTWEIKHDANYDWYTSYQFGFYDIEFIPSQENIIYVCGTDFMKSTNYGETWTTVTSEITPDPIEQISIERAEMAVCDLYPNKIWMMYHIYPTFGANKKLVIKLLDLTTNSLTEIITINNSISGIGKNKMELTISPNSINQLYIGGMSLLSLVGNGPASYISSGTPPNWIHSNIRDIQVIRNPVDPSKDLLFIACDGGIVVGGLNNNSQYSWNNISDDGTNGLNITEFYDISVSPTEKGFVVGGTQDLSGFYMRDNDWFHFSGSDGQESIHHPTIPGTFFYANGCGSSILKRYTDAAPGTPTSMYSNSTTDYYFNDPVINDPVEENTLYFGQELDLIRYSNSTGTIIQENIVIPNLEESISDIAIPKEDNQTIYVSTIRQYYWWSVAGNTTEPPSEEYFENCLFKSTDRGATWVDISSNLSGCYYGYIRDIEVNPYDKNELWIAFGSATETAKVYHSTNGGLLFTPLGAGLPTRMPTNQIRYDHINKRLYAATDVGIFTKTTLTNDNWVSFNNNLPLKIVMDIEISNTDNKLYAATYGRGIWATDIPCEVSSSSIYINTGGVTIWDGSNTLGGDLTIESGSTLEIMGELYIAPDCGITVKKGAKLYLQNATLNAACGDLWQGIYVEGDPNSKAAPPPYQGMLVATNGTIENAVCAITVGCAPDAAIDSDDGIGISTGCGGGIVQCSGTQFLNNKRSVKFDAYSYDNLSYFKTCTFEADNNYLATAAGNTRPDDFVKLTSVRGVRFIASDFESNIGTSSVVKYGIYAQNSGFSVLDYSSTPSTFSNLSYGVYSLTTSGTLGQTIQDSQFDMCSNGIYLSGSTAATVLSNTFSIPNAATSYGLYLDGCSGYHIENNSFAGTGSTASAIGCYVNNSGDDNNEIYRNYFENLEVALVSLGENTDGASNGDGLCFVCNEFTDCSTDIKVTDICVGCPSGATAGVRNVQSDIDNQTVSAANKFLTGVSGHIDFYNDGADITYKYYQGNTTIEKPVQLGGTNVITTNGVSQNSCPSKLTGGGGAGEEADSDAPNSSVNTMWQTNNLRIDGNSSYREPLIHASSGNKKSEESIRNSDDELVVLPNPNSGAFTISLPDNSGVLEVVNMQGIFVYRTDVDQQTIKLNLDHLSTGIYFVRYSYGENMENCTTTKLQIVK